MNVFNGIFIDLLHPNLVKQFLSSEMMKYYSKTEVAKGTMTRGLGSGLVFSEGHLWKMKKKVLT